MRQWAAVPERLYRLPTLFPEAAQPIEAVVARYQRVAPAVTRFARTLSGNDHLTVLLGSVAAASEDEVVVDPRLFQAAAVRGAPVTPDEMAIASALHEVLHLVSTDLDQELIDQLEKAGPVATTLFFALEDGRQETQALRRYQGARSVLGDLYRAALGAAIGVSGALSQFVIGCFLGAARHLDMSFIESRADPQVTLVLRESLPLLDRAAAAPNATELLPIALELMESARRHGLIAERGRDAPAASLASERREANEATEDLDRVRLISPIVHDLEGYETTKRVPMAATADSERKGPAELANDASTDQLLRVSQAPVVYLPTGMGGKLVLEQVPSAFARFSAEGRQSMAAAARRWGLAQRQVASELFPLFAANQRRGLRSGYDQGDVSPHAALFIGAGLYQRMYERRAAATRRSYAVSLLVDASASMLQPRGDGAGRSPWGLAAAVLGAITLARLCDDLTVDFEVALFNRGFAARETDTEWSFTRNLSQATAGLRRTQGGAAARLTSTVNHYLVKGFGRRWREAEDLLAGLFYAAAEPTAASTAVRRDPRTAPPLSMFERAANVDEFNLIHAAERMAKLGAQVRVMVVLADGMTRGSVEALESAVRAIERSGTIVLGIGIGDDTVAGTYQRFEVVTRPEELTRAMIDGTRGALRRGLALWGLDTWWQRPVRSMKEAVNA
ncbi:MAG TPA: hypothetical protein VID03_05805 [Acidimicrobiia bacterium]